MKKIVAPLQLGDRGTAVANLQAALLVLVDRDQLRLPDNERNDLLSTRLPREQAEQVYGQATARIIVLFRVQNRLNDLNIVDQPTAAALNEILAEFGALDEDQPFVVKGTIRQANGSLFVGAIVQAFDKDLRSEQLLGEKPSDRRGSYEISYTAEQFQLAEKESADLIVRVLNSAGQLQVASPIIFNAKPVEIVDLTIITEEDRARSEYERLLAEFRPLLGNQAISDLREDTEENPAEGKYRDITFLSGETGFEKNVLARFVMAHKLAQQAIQPEFWFVLLGGSFYQFAEDQNLDQQLAAILDSLPSLDAAAVDKAFTRGFNQREIPEALRENVDSWVEAFLRFVASRTVSESDRPLSNWHWKMPGFRAQKSRRNLPVYLTSTRR